MYSKNLFRKFSTAAAAAAARRLLIEKAVAAVQHLGVEIQVDTEVPKGKLVVRVNPEDKTQLDDFVATSVKKEAVFDVLSKVAVVASTADTVTKLVSTADMISHIGLKESLDKLSEKFRHEETYAKRTFEMVADLHKKHIAQSPPTAAAAGGKSPPPTDGGGGTEGKSTGAAGNGSGNGNGCNGDGNGNGLYDLFQ